MARKQKARQAKLWLAAQVEAVARGAIDQSHARLTLNGVALRYAFQQRLPKRYGREVPCTVSVVGGKAAALAAGLPESQVPIEREEQFFLVVFGWSWWRDADPARRLAEVDAALCYCGVNDKGGLVIWPPDVIGHREAIERHGLYSHDLKQFGKSIQGALDLEGETVPDAKSAAAGKDEAHLAHLEEALAAGLTNYMPPDEASALVAEQAALDAAPSRFARDAERLEAEAAEEAEAGRKRVRRAPAAAAPVVPLAH